MSIAAVGASSLLQQYQGAGSAKTKAPDTPGVADHDGDHSTGSAPASSSSQAAGATASGRVSTYA